MSLPGMPPQLQSGQSIHSIQSMESTTPYAVTNVVVLRSDPVSRREVWRMDEAVTDPLTGCSKQHPPRAMLIMGISTAVIHHATMDLQ